jgi:histidyl-tRNA synthetase
MITAPKGTADTFGAEAYAWQQVETVIRRLCSDFCIEEIRTPTFENLDLYKRGVGETTDVVQKEMFTFTNRDGAKHFALRPELTAGVARAFIERGMQSDPKPVKFYYMASAFRAEQPQKGRLREFHQFGVEILGSSHAACDAEVVSVAAELLRRLNVKNVELRINSLGNADSRARYNDTLKGYIRENMAQLCPLCRERAERNPLRVLDCKNEGCGKIMAAAPSVLDSLGEDCKKHFQDVQAYLSAMGIPFVVDDRIVRGLDYYTRTVFEFVSTNLGAQATVCGGGRYDGLIEEVGGGATAACGFAMGLERLLIILEAQGNKPAYMPANDLFIGAIGERGVKKAQALVYDLRKKGISAETDTLGRSVKAQMKDADKIGSKYSFIIGDNELEQSAAKIKDMATGEQTVVGFAEIAAFLRQ